MQISLFDGNKKFENNKPIRLIELFGGISAQATALHELGVDFEHYKYVDFDKYAVKSTNAIYRTNWKTTDITKITAKDLDIVDTDKYNYIVTYSFPCQDLSLAGQGAGMAKGSGTRSGLLWEVERLLLEAKEKPQVLLMENVPEVIGAKNMPHFAEWIKALEEMGYKNYWENLKATDFGIPQSRNRTFMISILGDYYYSFPKPIKLEFLLKDMLETNVDEKYYLSDKLLNYHTKRNSDNGHFGVFNPKKKEDAEIARTIHNTGLNRTDDNFIAEPKLEQVGSLNIKGNDSIKRVYSTNGLSPTLTTMTGGNRQPKIQEQSLKQQLANKIIESGRVKEYDIIRHSYSNSRIEGKREIAESNNLSPTLDTRCDCLGVVEPQLIGGFGEKKSNGGTQWYQQDRVYDSNAVSLSVTTSFHPNYSSNLRIRKLTPKECWRLMGFRDELFYKAEAVNSNAQLYKQAGNSIVTTVLMAIFGELLGVDWKSNIEDLINCLRSNNE